MEHFMPEIITLGWYDASVAHKNVKTTRKRRVSLYEIELVLEDGGTAYIDDKEYKIKKDDIFFAKPGQLRMTRLPYKCLYIHLFVDNKEITRQLDLVPDTFTPQNPDEYKNLILSLIATHSSASENNIISLEKGVFDILYQLIGSCKDYNPSSKNASSEKIIKKALLYIEENISKNITLEDIASEVHLSRIYFHNLFIKAVGETTHQYILKKRLHKAKQLLQSSEKTISVIAEECGFKSQSYFNYVFKKETGISPGKFKNLSPYINSCTE